MSYPPTPPTYTITEELDYPTNIWRWATTDPVKGASGAGATDDVDNYPITQLANRTKYLKSKTDGLTPFAASVAKNSSSSNQTIHVNDNSSASAKLTFDKVEFDSKAIFSLSNNEFTVPSDGIYSINANAIWQDPNNLTCWLEVYINGSIYKRGCEAYSPAAGQNISTPISVIAELSAADVISIYATVNNSESGKNVIIGAPLAQTDNSSAYTYAQVMYCGSP